MAEIIDFSTRRIARVEAEEADEIEALLIEQEGLIRKLEELLDQAENGEIVGLQFIAIDKAGPAEQGALGLYEPWAPDLLLVMEMLRAAILHDYLATLEDYEEGEEDE